MRPHGIGRSPRSRTAPSVRRTKCGRHEPPHVRLSFASAITPAARSAFGKRHPFIPSNAGGVTGLLAVAQRRVMATTKGHAKIITLAFRNPIINHGRERVV